MLKLFDQNCNPRCKVDGHSAPTCQISALNILRCGQHRLRRKIIKAVISKLAHYVVVGKVKIEAYWTSQIEETIELDLTLQLNRSVSK